MFEVVAVVGYFGGGIVVSLLIGRWYYRMVMRKLREDMAKKERTHTDGQKPPTP